MLRPTESLTHNVSLSSLDLLALASICAIVPLPGSIQPLHLLDTIGWRHKVTATALPRFRTSRTPSRLGCAKDPCSLVSKHTLLRSRRQSTKALVPALPVCAIAQVLWTSPARRSSARRGLHGCALAKAGAERLCVWVDIQGTSFFGRCARQHLVGPSQSQKSEQTAAACSEEQQFFSPAGLQAGTLQSPQRMAEEPSLAPQWLKSGITAAGTAHSRPGEALLLPLPC